VGSQHDATATLTTGKKHGTYCARDWVGPRADQGDMNKFYTEDPQIIGITVQNLVTQVTWSPGFVPLPLFLGKYSVLTVTIAKRITICMEEIHNF
jgi:hypothetical protein